LHNLRYHKSPVCCGHILSSHITFLLRPAWHLFTPLWPVWLDKLHDTPAVTYHWHTTFCHDHFIVVCYVWTVGNSHHSGYHLFITSRHVYSCLLLVHITCNFRDTAPF